MQSWSLSLSLTVNATLKKNDLTYCQAIGVSFDTNIGHDYLEQVDERYDYYHEQEERIPLI